ncbi:MAG: Rieske 2Fe-2S domain-containing protein [Jatrophihabitans sp.]
MRTPKFLEKFAETVEQAEALDKPAAALVRLVGKVIRPGPVEDTLSGVPLGHPLHPLLVAVPIGAWVSAGVLDATGNPEGARQLTALGVLAAIPTAATGGSDWLSTEGAEKRVGFVHALANYTAVGAYGLSWWARSRGNRGLGVVVSLAGASALGVAGWLGGHLAYAQGVGVDTTAFQQFPTEWTDVGATAELPAGGSVAVVQAAGVPVLVTRRGDSWLALADRCTHRGGPLHEGKISNGCIVCPWHASAFSLDDGTVQRGPATRPQPVLDTRVEDGRLLVRRAESHALRINPTGI